MSTNRKSSLDRLDPRIQSEVNAAIKEGRASIDEIVSMIKSMGGDASRSAVVQIVRRIWVKGRKTNRNI